jgi:hypothetical protein
LNTKEVGYILFNDCDEMDIKGGLGDAFGECEKRL